MGGATGAELQWGDYQNYGPFLGPCYNTGPYTGPNLGDPKREHNFDNLPMVEEYHFRGLGPLRDLVTLAGCDPA